MYVVLMSYFGIFFFVLMREEIQKRRTTLLQETSRTKHLAEYGREM